MGGFKLLSDPGEIGHIVITKRAKQMHTDTFCDVGEISVFERCESEGDRGGRVTVGGRRGATVTSHLSVRLAVESVETFLEESRRTSSVGLDS